VRVAGSRPSLYREVLVVRRWACLLFLGPAVGVGGWGLVRLSGHGGDSTGGSELVWRIGGLMVYLSVPVLLLAAVWVLLGMVRLWARRRACGT